MYQGYRVVFFLLCNYLTVLALNRCDIICDTQGCRAEIVDLGLNSCTNKDIETILNNINFTIRGGTIPEYSANLEISFIPPKNECMCTVTLLANELINETECTSYNFQNSYGIIVHTQQKNICFVTNTASNLNINYPYIFSACYAVQFSNHENYTFKKFLKTNYRRTEITTPQLTCTYQILGDNETKEKLHFEVDLSIQLISEVNLGLGLINNSTAKKTCDIYGEVFELGKNWSFDISDIYYEFKNNTSNISMLNNGKYRKLISFDIEPIKNRSYCFYINLIDERSRVNSSWNPSYRNCYSVSNQKGKRTISTRISTSNYMYEIVIITLLLIFVILVTVCFVYVANTRIWKKLYGKSDQLNVLKDKDSFTMCTDIVLIYPKGSELFMSLMAQFREILSTACQCSVHDWYNAKECNYVAEIGGSDWFAEMLNKGCRIVWVDTPASRSLITQRFKSRTFVKNFEEYEICDFRDIILTTIFDLAKRNMEQSMQQQHKHFIVRLKKFESFENENDPFLSLSPDTRYIIPQDLHLLCSNLSLLESKVMIPFINDEDKFVKHHMYCAENDFYK